MAGKRIRTLFVIGAVLASALSGALRATVSADSSVGSFEIDGNRPDDSGAGEPLDWDSASTGSNPVTVTGFTDAFNVQKEDGFGGHSSNDGPATWACDQVSVPSKDDIQDGAIGFRIVNGDQFVYVNFDRVGNNGTADLDFELNRGGVLHPSPPCQGILPGRSDGDLIIAFDQQGQTSTAADVHLYRWTGNATTGVLTDLTANVQFQGQLSTGRLFGEAALNLTKALGRPIACGEFSTAYMKSRASTSINSDLKDRTATRPLDIGSCPASNLDKAVRNYTTNGNFGDTATASPGQTLEYQLTYTNAGPGIAHNVVVTDTLQPNQTLVSGSCSPSCTVNGSKLTWTFASVGANSPQVMTFRVTLDASFPAGATTITNTGSVDTTEEAPKDSDTVTTTVNAAPNVTRSKSASPNPASVGQTVTYTLAYTNSGNASATYPSIVDDYDENHLTVSNISNGGTASAGKITWSNITVAAAATVNLTYQATVTGTYAGSSGTCATGQYPVLNTVTDSQGSYGNTLCVIASPNVTRSKSASPNPASVGQVVTYTITYDNTGDAAKTFASIVDDYDEGHLTVGTISNGGTASGGKITWSNITVAAKSTVTLTYQATVVGFFTGSPGGGTCTTAQYPVFNTVADSQGTFGATLCVNAAPNVTRSKSASPNPANVGQVVTYTITYNNTGDAAKTYPSIVDDYDQAHLSVDNATISP
ncbi:MAG TPA: Ig-like domain-containing protein, partial [Acidimicrobiales bacterium]|nr:Ig-like domain-containing protein [Acidimicrobiales bacterium]